MSTYKTRKTLSENVSNLYKKGYKKESNTIKTNEKLMKKLSHYSKSTQREFLAQAEKAGLTASESLTFIRATERYNRERSKKYDEYVKKYVNPAWEAHVKEQTKEQGSAWRRMVFGDKGGLTKEGQKMYSQFLESQLSPIIALQDKSIIIGDWEAEALSKERILDTRMRMGMSDYLDTRKKQYIENFKAAIGKTHEFNSQWYISKFDGLTEEEKINFIREGGKIIEQTYISKNESDYAQLFMELIDKVTSRLEKDNE